MKWKHLLPTEYKNVSDCNNFFAHVFLIDSFVHLCGVQ